MSPHFFYNQLIFCGFHNWLYDRFNYQSIFTKYFMHSYQNHNRLIILMFHVEHSITGPAPPGRCSTWNIPSEAYNPLITKVFHVEHSCAWPGAVIRCSTWNIIAHMTGYECSTWNIIAHLIRFGCSTWNIPQLNCLQAFYIKITPVDQNLRQFRRFSFKKEILIRKRLFLPFRVVLNRIKSFEAEFPEL